MKYKEGDTFILKRWNHIVPTLDRYKGGGEWLVRWYAKDSPEYSWTNTWPEKEIDKEMTLIEKPSIQVSLPEGLFEI